MHSRQAIVPPNRSSSGGIAEFDLDTGAITLDIMNAEVLANYPVLSLVAHMVIPRLGSYPSLMAGSPMTMKLSASFLSA